MSNQGLPITALLLFAILIWILYILIFFSSPKNKVNQWCCICGLILSLGVLKEYIYYGGFLSEVLIFSGRIRADEWVYSVLTAILYYLGVPCVMLLSFYFCDINKRKPGLFHFLRYIIFLPAIIFSIVYPWGQTKQIMNFDTKAFAIVADYNLGYGIILTILIIRNLLKERNRFRFQQRKYVLAIMLLPFWYWLITIFLIHQLRWESLYKSWQGNALIIPCLLVYYLYHLFHNGMLGMKLSSEYYDWSSDIIPIPDNMKYIVHMLKNETAKLRLGMHFVRKLEVPELQEELDVMERSVDHIDEFVRRSREYSGKIFLNLVDVDMKELFETVAAERAARWNGKVVIQTGEKRSLFCDRSHMKEVLSNLAANALDAMGEDGRLTFKFQMQKRGMALICVSDTGCGIPEENISHIFDPYFTKHLDSTHFGLGLAYCQNVIRAHRGYIKVESNTGAKRHGTEFILCMPQRYGERRKRLDQIH